MKKLHWYYKFLIVFLIFFSMFFLLTENMSKIVNSSGYKNYVNFISVPFNFINKYNIFNYRNVLKQNDELSKKIIVVNTTESERDNLLKEVEELRSTLKIKDVYTSYKKVYSKVILRNKMYWYSTVTIDKGSIDNIEEGDAVINKDGLIGKVKNVTKNYSTVKLITDESSENKISTVINLKDKKLHGTIIGYEYPYIKIELITDSKGVKKGDKVYTSGLGNFPKNIYIGTVEKIVKDSFGVSYILYVTPASDMNDIGYVAVLKRK